MWWENDTSLADGARNMVQLVQTLSNVPSVAVNAKRLLERNNQYKVTMILNSTYFNRPSMVCMDLVYQQPIITYPWTRKVVKWHPISIPQWRMQLLPVTARVIRDAYRKVTQGPYQAVLELSSNNTKTSFLRLGALKLSNKKKSTHRLEMWHVTGSKTTATKWKRHY